jgi:hypothetical protein
MSARQSQFTVFFIADLMDECGQKIFVDIFKVGEARENSRSAGGQASASRKIPAPSS